MGIAAVSSRCEQETPSCCERAAKCFPDKHPCVFRCWTQLGVFRDCTSECVSAVPSTSAESVPAKPVAVAPDWKASLNGFLVKKCVMKGEVVWCLNTIVTHGSFRSAAASAALFPIMFPTCDVAKKLQLGKDKVGYTICYGIAPYFRNRLLSKLHGVPHVVVAFDESLWDPADESKPVT